MSILSISFTVMSILSISFTFVPKNGLKLNQNFASVCGYACVLNMELRRHMMRHTGQRPYKCRVCDRRFGDFGSRQKHERPVDYLTGFEAIVECFVANTAFVINITSSINNNQVIKFLWQASIARFV